LRNEARVLAPDKDELMIQKIFRGGRKVSDEIPAGRVDPGVLNKSQVSELCQLGYITGVDNPGKAVDLSSIDLSLSESAFKMIGGLVKPSGEFDYDHLLQNPKLATAFNPSADGTYSLKAKSTYVFKLRERLSRLYASSPQKALVGEATVNSVTSGSPNDIWSQFGSSIGCTRDQFTAYAGSACQLCAIELSDVKPYREPIGLAQASHLVREHLIPPQSYCDLPLNDKNSPWVKAVSVASLLHGRFGFRERAL
jgi:predicted transcriptional regulator